MPEPEMVELPRLTVASLLDYLTDYQAELQRADAEGPYTDELTKEVERVATLLQESET